MIVPEAELIVMLGMDASTMTVSQQAILQQIHAEAESQVIQYLNYDPEQQEHTEYYPRRDYVGGTGTVSPGIWTSNGTTATLRNAYGSGGDITLGRTLQLQHLPVRQVSLLRVSTSGQFGVGSTGVQQWTLGTDFWPQNEAEDYCKTGLLIANGAWPLEPGSVLVRYIAGYSPSELSGRADALAQTADAENGIYTKPGVNAAAIKRAVTLTVAKGMHTQQDIRQDSSEGFSGGTTYQRERWQDYEYERPSDTSLNQLTGLMTGLPNEAQMLLEKFKNMGTMRL